MSSNDYGVVEVIYKPTGEKRLIKWDRFNPELHKQVGEVFSKDYALVYNQPVHIQVDDVGKALAMAAKKQDEAAKVMAAKVEEAAKKEVALPENTVDSEVEQTEPDYSAMKMPEVRAAAKAKGIKFLPTDKKSEIVAKIKDSQSPNP